MTASRQTPDVVRVLHVVSLLGHGGMEAGVMKLVAGCDRSRVLADVCSLEPACAFKDLFTGDSRLHELSRRTALDLRLVKGLAAIMRQRAIDVVHTHAWGTLVEGWMAARLAGVRHFIHGEHGTLESRPLNVAVQRRLWRRTDKLLAVSRDLAERMARTTGTPFDRIEVIPNGVEIGPELSREQARVALSLAPDQLVALAVGRLVPVKNYRLLLAAARGLTSVEPRWRFLIAGDGPLRSELEREIASMNLGEHVTLLGHRADIPMLMGAADAFVIPSSSEGMSNTILEAMSAARPVVATRVGGNPELVHEGVTGMLVSPHAAMEFCVALRALGESAALRKRMGRAGRQRAEREFSRARMIEDYTQMYETVVGGVRSVESETTGHGRSIAAPASGDMR